MSSQPPPSTDDLFASLGGSLMKDLWADLQGADDTEEDEAMMGWSLEQLERELAHLEDDGGPAPPSTQLPFPADAAGAMPSAASLVVSHAQERSSLQTQPAATTPAPTVSAADAWSQSLQNFTALSLEQDFLAADSARKQSVTATPAIDADLLRNVQEYNVSEVATVHPPSLPTTTMPSRPPGMPSPAQKQKAVKDVSVDGPNPPLLPIKAEEDVSVKQSAPPPSKPLPPTPQNSEASLPHRVPPTPQNSFVSLPFSPVPPTPPTSRQVSLAEAGSVAAPRPPLGVVAMPMPPQQSAIMTHPPTSSATATAAAAVLTGTRGPAVTGKPASAWQTPAQTAATSAPTSRIQLTRPIYCQLDPAAPPIPSAALESSLMTARDLAYVLHSMLKPVLLAGVSADDYDILLWQKRSGRINKAAHYHGAAPTSSSVAAAASSTTKLLQEEMSSRAQRTKEWTTEQKTLGHTAKSDVSRPRALIAIQTADGDKDATSSAPNKERASLWKARLYVDQGYQAYNAVVDVWSAAPHGTGVPREIQPHLVKLLKCLGVKLETTTAPSDSSTYTVDKAALSLLLKLPKGQTLLARILEQALLPPNAVQAILPVVLSIAVHSPFCDEICNVRLFRACSTVVSTLPNMEGACLVQSVRAMEDPDALKSTARMECIHSLLQRGNALSAQDASFAPEWTKTEQEFMQLLG